MVEHVVIISNVLRNNGCPSSRHPRRGVDHSQAVLAQSRCARRRVYVIRGVPRVSVRARMTAGP